MNKSKATYKIFSQFYDIYTKDFNKDLPLYKTFCAGKNKILEIGCGTGRVLTAINEKGKNITGVDISREMLEIAKQKLKNEKIKLIEHDFYKKSLNDKFDIILITWFTFNYIIEYPEAFLYNVAKTLRTGACIILDLFYPQPLKKPEINDVWTEKEITYKEERIVLKDKRKIENNIEERIQIYKIKDKEFKIETKRRYYSKKEILYILKKTGFNNIQFIDNYDINTMRILKENEITFNDFICFCK